MGFPATVLVAGQDSTKITDPSFVTEGDYSYSSNENRNIQGEDVYVFRDDCFMRSSCLESSHLAELSASAVLASVSRYGQVEEPCAINLKNSGQNIKAMLKDIGFKNVETNKYYDLEKLENSIGVCIGSKKIEAYGKTYTLLAIIPSSAG